MLEIVVADRIRLLTLDRPERRAPLRQGR